MTREQVSLVVEKYAKAPELGDSRDALRVRRVRSPDEGRVQPLRASSPTRSLGSRRVVANPQE